MTPQGKKIWNSKAGGDLAMAMMGEKPMTDEDRKTLDALRQGGQRKTTETTPPSPKAKPDFSSGPRPLTSQEIESLRKSRQETGAAGEAYFRKLLNK